MKKIILIFSVLIMALNLNAQNFEGRIVFNLEYPKLPNPEMASMMPKETVSYFKGGKSRMEMNMSMGMKNATITDAKTGEAVVLMDMMGQKYALTGAGDDPESKKASEEAKVTVTKETKKIAGYTCTKAIIEVPSKDKGVQSMEAWFTKDLKFVKGYAKGPLGKLDGLILQYSILQNGMEMILTAREVVKESVSDDKFAVPADYTKMTQEEFMKAMGQGAK
jgi:GLPGLI family protein